jgi:hypothetical protein
MDCFGESKGMPARAGFVTLLAGMSGTGRSHIALTVGSLRCHHVMVRSTKLNS